MRDGAVRAARVRDVIRVAKWACEDGADDRGVDVPGPTALRGRCARLRRGSGLDNDGRGRILLDAACEQPEPGQRQQPRRAASAFNAAH